MATNHLDGRSVSLRRQADEALRFAVQGEWEKAVEANRRILEVSSRDVDAFNRLGKALMELGRFPAALEAYQATIEIDPGNAIARRNLVRLEQATASAAAAVEAPPPAPAAVRARVFIEEVGKTYVTDLTRPATFEALSRIAPADEVELRPAGNQVEVFTVDGVLLGQLEPRIAQRLIRLLQMGNRYQAFVVALTGNTVRVILREVFRNPAVSEPASFPRQAKIAAPRPYLRDTGRLAREMGQDLLLDSDDDDDDADDESEEPDTLDEETDEEEEFIDEPSAAEDEEPPISH